MGGVFVSYRREDSAGWTGRICDYLSTRLGEDRVFVDTSAIRPGEDFAQAIEDLLDRVDTVLVVIGRGWLNAPSEDGHRRLHDPGDYVRREVAGALSRECRVVPVLVDGASMPTEADLPHDIVSLALRNAVSITNTRFAADMEVLLAGFDEESPAGGTLVSTSLPVRVASFVGRQQELADIEKLVESSRLVTLVGAGGSGKTTLAIEFARRSAKSFPDGVWFADLTAIDDPADTPRAVAAGLGVREDQDTPLVDQLVDRLSPKRCLILVDNCEHVVDAAAALISELVAHTRGPKVLATSRERLDISGEHLYPVPALDLPTDADYGVDNLTRSTAVQLFVERAQTVRPGFSMTEANAGAVATICRRLDGLPLALELVAARLNVLSPTELQARLDDRLTLLTASSRDRPSRQRTLAATLEWSHDLLSDDEKKLFRRLAVFRGGFSIAAAETICAHEDVHSSRILDLLSSLVAKSLITPADAQGDSRFQMLETVAAFAATKLADAREKEEARRRHAAYYREIAIDSYDAAWSDREAKVFDQLEEEWPNVDRALEWHLETGNAQDGLMMAGSLYRFAASRYYAPPLVEWLDKLIAADTTPGPALMRATLAIGTMSESGPTGSEGFDRAIALARDHGTADDLFAVLTNAAVRAHQVGDEEGARPLEAELATIRPSHPAARTFQLRNRAADAIQSGPDWDLAAALTKEALEQARLSGSAHLLMDTWLFAASLRRNTGDPHGARQALGEATRISEELKGRHSDVGRLEVEHAELAMDDSDLDQARAYLKSHNELVGSFVTEDEARIPEVARVLYDWARLALLLGRPDAAVTLLAAQRAQFAATSTVAPAYEQQLAKDLETAASKQLDATSIRAARERGAGFDLQEALNYGESVKRDNE